MSKQRGRPAGKKAQEGKAGKKKVKVQVDYSMWQDIGNTIRIDAINAVHVTKSGHPTSAASIADILAVLFFNEHGMKFHAEDPSHFLNDRLVLSKGHACPGLYSAFCRAGIVPEKQLLSLRLKDAILEGHPVPKIPFVDIATGSLGQGYGVAAGMAYSSKYLDKIDNHIYAILGDGQCAEGSVWQAAAFASYYKLNNLIAFVDVNALGQSQQTMFLHHTEVYEKKFLAFGCNAVTIDGHSIKAIIEALDAAKQQKEKPTVIVCRTEKGKNFLKDIEGQLNWHGKDLGNKVEQNVNHLKSLIKHEKIEFKTFPPTGDKPNLQLGTVCIKPHYEKGSKISTRKAYGNGLVHARESNPNVFGLDGDTKNSTFSTFLFEKYPQSFVECFIAEQNMISVAQGIACRNKIPFVSTFACFLIRAADQIRIGGISSSKVKFVGSHSGVSIGEDGPSQMALEDIAFFRTLPNGIVLIPADGASAQKSVQIAANYHDGPAFIRTARPDVPIIYDNEEPFQLGKLKVIRKSNSDKAVFIGVSVTVHQGIKAADKLAGEGINIRVIDLFSVKPIDTDGLIKNIDQCNGNVIIAEEHYPEGGIYEPVLAAAFKSIKKAEHLCVRKIPGSATPQQQLQIHGLDSNSIISKVKILLE